MKCTVCKKEASVALKSHNSAFCDKCYLDFFSRQVERGIKEYSLFTRDDRILVALSGGKDSLALALELKELGYAIAALFIDLAIPGSSEIAREHVRRFCGEHGIPLLIKETAADGLAIPVVKKALKRPVCSVCGKIKRYYFNRIALEEGFDVLATGHNLDDEIGRLYSNVLRWDEEYLAAQGPYLPSMPGYAAKVRPLWRLTEFETANYSFLRGINPCWAPCPYSAGASFSVLKEHFHKLELKMPGRKLNFYQGFLEKGKRHFEAQVKRKTLFYCLQCGDPVTNGNLCAICRMKEMVKERI